MQDKVIRNPNLQTFCKQGIGTLRVIYVNNVAYVRHTDIVKCICPNSTNIAEFKNPSAVVDYVKASCIFKRRANFIKNCYID